MDARSFRVLEFFENLFCGMIIAKVLTRHRDEVVTIAIVCITIFFLFKILI